MTTSTFYDTVIFLLARNTKDKDCPHCQKLLDPQTINWAVAFSELSRAEASIGEFLDAFVQQCALQGISLTEVPMSSISKHIKKIHQTRRRLEQAGMQLHDIKQSTAAHSVPCSLFITRDWDFKNPKNKKNRSTKKNTTSDIISEDLNMTVCMPHEACGILV